MKCSTSRFATISDGPRRSTALCEAELVRKKSPQWSINDPRIPVAEAIDWFNHRHLSRSAL